MQAMPPDSADNSGAPPDESAENHSGSPRWVGIGSLFRLRIAYGLNEPLETQRARLVLRVGLSLILVVLVGLVNWLISYQPETSDPILLVGFIIAFAGALAAIILVQRGAGRSATYTLVATLTMGVAAALFPHSYNNIGVLLLMVPLPLAAVLLGRSGLLITAWALFAALIVSSFASSPKLMAPDLLLADALKDTQLIPVSIIFIGGLLIAVNSLVLWFVAIEQQSRAKLQQHATQSTLLTLRLNRVLAAYTSRETLLGQIPDELRDQFGYYYVQIFTLDRDNQLLIRPLRIGSFSAQARAERRIRLDDAQNVVAQVVRSGKSRVVALNSPLTDRTEFLNATRQELFVVVRHQDRIWGVIDIHSVQADSFGPRDIEIIENLSSQIATALSMLESKQRIQTLSQDRSKLQDQVDRLTRDLEQLREQTNVRAWIGYFSDRHQMATGFDWRDGNLQPNEAMTPSLTEAFAKALPRLQLDGEQQVLNIPISVRGLQLGTIEFRSDGQNAWNDSSLELARLIGQRLALILDNVRLVEQSRESELRERLINQVSGRLQVETDLDKLLATAADAFSQALGASNTRIQLTTPNTLMMPLSNGQAVSIDSSDPLGSTPSPDGER